ncbi:MAG TPA: putative sulfate/molybdate transporter [Methanoregulaceae archaeon]|nr:putative sulfate/molybdate transporter [Methanoregulaceae archaeon]MDD5048359.1 putative sulfate/molybdate transporter [Methanoregulaceae archaeon]MDD5684223.1 putative sulfate/molybdate transporter [Methanoregulaceae archaeon]HOP66617.1 putative sulfate/molybdate transporter [Methanoregulaceae archaeon]HPJ73268.1 putative sulfate/molybdate transporter [Methanoregulaceae archaeon]
MNGSEDENIPKIRFDLSELAGSMGDFGTILPLVLAVALVAGLDIGYIFLFFGIWFVISGLLYRVPVPVEPMKVIAVIAIAEAIGPGEIAAAGILLGVIFLVLGTGNWMNLLEKWIPDSVIRGIQLGLALLLLKTSGGFMLEDPIYFVFGVAIIVGIFLFSRWRKIPDLSSLVLIFLALGAGILVHGVPQLVFLSPPALVLPKTDDFIPALSVLVIPQALLTLTNAILATSLLSRDLMSVKLMPARLSRTIGLMNLVSVPFGGMPMCHGAGGMAGMYRFGARTGGANIIAGGIFVILALFFAGPSMVSLISVGVYGALLVFVALELAKHAWKTESIAVTITIGILSLVFSMTVAFFIGMALAYLLLYIEKKQSAFHPD